MSFYSQVYILSNLATFCKLIYLILFYYKIKNNPLSLQKIFIVFITKPLHPGHSLECNDTHLLSIDNNQAFSQ